MTDNGHDQSSNGDGERVILTAEERQLRSELLAAARQLDRPSSTLERSLLEQIAPEASAPGPLRRWLRTRSGMGVAALGLAAGVAAAVGIVLYRDRDASETIAPEPLASLPPPQPSTSSAAQDPCAKRYRAAGQHPLIDDFEDADSMVISAEGRSRPWLLNFDSDPPGEVLRVPGPKPRGDQRRDNRYALRLTGGKLHDWGATADLTFQPHRCYDASAYAGLEFWGKGPAKVLVWAREVRVVPRALGGSCDAQQQCYNVHSKALELTERWTHFVVRWTELRQTGEDTPPLDPTSLNGIQFHIPADSTPFDIMIDDVAFVRR